MTTAEPPPVHGLEPAFPPPTTITITITIITIIK